MSTQNTPYLFVMAGGSGTRFWPKSTSENPKQLLSFGANKGSLLEITLNRFIGWIPESHQIILTNKKIEAAVKKLTSSKTTVLAEPLPRNTAPCLYWGARHLAALNPHAVMVVMSSDHYIANENHFLTTVKMAAAYAQENKTLVTLGVTPTRPETGYGYLELGSRIGPSQAFQVNKFIEKPSLEKAKHYFESKKYLWNAGMFVWRVDAILEAFHKHMPEMDEIWQKYQNNPEAAFPYLTATSIDYGILEKSEKVVTFPLECGWDDLGSWLALETLSTEMKTQTQGGVCSDAVEWIALDSSQNIVDVPGKTLVTIGIEDTIIVSHKNVLLIAKKDKAQDIKKVVELLKQKHPELI